MTKNTYKTWADGKNVVSENDRKKLSWVKRSLPIWSKRPDSSPVLRQRRATSYS